MNVESLITEFRTRSGDKVKKYLWPDEELLPWLADAEKEAAIRARLIRDSDELSIAAGDVAVDLPAGLFDIQYAEIRGADGKCYEMAPSDHSALDSDRPGWRTKSERPREYIHNDKTLTLSAVADAAYSIYIEFFREPAKPLASDSDVPEINGTHHIHLIDWVMHKAYGKQDADTMDQGKSDDGEARFERYFGKRPNADLRRRQNASRPHRNKLHL